MASVDMVPRTPPLSKKPPLRSAGLLIKEQGQRGGQVSLFFSEKKEKIGSRSEIPVSSMGVKPLQPRGEEVPGWSLVNV